MFKYKDEGKQTTLCQQKMDIGVVINATKTFNQHDGSAHSCIEALTKAIFYLEQGNVLTDSEATSLFISITKLFQFNHPVLRRLSHVAIKILSTMSRDIIIATSSLMKDMIGGDQFIRASALRALCAITDATMLPGIERHIRQSIVDRNSGVSSAALVSSIRFISQNPEVVRSWSNEVAELCKNDDSITQYHALGLMYFLKQNDKFGLQNFFSKFFKVWKIPLSTVLCIRIAASTINENSDPNYTSKVVEFLGTCLHNRNEMVLYEACRALISLPSIPPQTVGVVVTVMRNLMAGPSSVNRYAAVSGLCHMSNKYPTHVSACSLDLETLTGDSDKGLATYALTALLKIGAESNVDRVIKLITSFILEVTETYRLIIIKELRNLMLKYPQKSQSFLNLISSLLKDEGGLEYKRTLVGLVITIIREAPVIKGDASLREEGLLLLCELIEDCDHPSLMSSVFQVLAQEGPSSKNPSQFIRFIYNRIVLESADIRAAAIACLAQFAIRVPALRRSILQIIERCFKDDDDEVRDRACFYHSLINTCSDLSFLITFPHVEPETWLKAIHKYLSESDGSVPFSTSDVKVVKEEISQPEAEKMISIEPEITSPVLPATHDDLLDLLPPSSELRFSHMTKPQQLSEAEEEFGIKCFFHIFDKAIIVEFLITNTLSGHQMRNVSVQISVPREFKVLNHKGCELIGPSDTGKCYIVLELPEDPSYITETFSSQLIFSLFKLDTSSQWVPIVSNDQLPLDKIELNLEDHFKPVSVDFEREWEKIPSECEVEETCALEKYTSIKEAAEVVIKLLGLSVCDNSDEIVEKSTVHKILLSGVYRTGVLALVLLSLKRNQQHGILMKVRVRCEDQDVIDNILSVIS